MNRTEFRKRLDQLQEVITLGLAYYAVWSKLRLHDETVVSWSLEQQNKVLGRWKGFFTPVGSALVDMVLMQFAKVFDTRRGTASLSNLLLAARQDASLVSDRQPNEVAQVSRQLRQQKNVLRRLRLRRNKWIAHVDANPGPVDPIMSQEIQSLAEDVKSAFKWLSTAHRGSVISWDSALRTCERDSTDVVDILLREFGRKQKEHQEEIERIVLEDIRRGETLVGRSLDKEEMLSVMQTYGLAEEEMQRVKKKYGTA